jgi:hypothetical protein
MPLAGECHGTGVKMKLDMDLVRDLLLKIEAAEEPPNLEDIAGASGTVRNSPAAYHMRMLIKEAAFVRGIDACHMQGDNWLELHLTWSGHEFLNTLRDPTIWEQTKTGAKALGGVGFDMLLALGKEYAKQKAKTVLGLDLG